MEILNFLWLTWEAGTTTYINTLSYHLGQLTPLTSVATQGWGLNLSKSKFSTKIKSTLSLILTSLTYMREKHIKQFGTKTRTVENDLGKKRAKNLNYKYINILKNRKKNFSLNAAWLAGKEWDQWTSAAPPVVPGTARLSKTRHICKPCLSVSKVCFIASDQAPETKNEVPKSKKPKTSHQNQSRIPNLCFLLTNFYYDFFFN